MKIIGIVGDIGSGKSFVAKQFDCPIFDADHEVNKIYNENRFCYNKLKKKLPKYISSFPIKKNHLKKAILINKSNLKKIINIVHPIIRTKMKKFFKKNNKKKVVVLDIPLLMENKINKNNYILIFVDAEKREILKRLKKRPRYNAKIYYKLKKLQLPLEFKKKNSNYVIKNNFKISTVKKNVKMIKKKILNK